MNFQSLMMGISFFSRLPLFLRHRLTLTEAEWTIANRRKEREEQFLRILQQSIFAHPDSPYQALFREAGCEFGDVERLVHEQGLEPTLQTLFRNGVFISVDEFKGCGGKRKTIGWGTFHFIRRAYHHGPA